MYQRMIVLLIATSCLLFSSVCPSAKASSDLELQGDLTQNDFNNLVRDLGTGLSYIPAETPEPRDNLGFQVGVEINAVDLRDNRDYMQKAFEDNDPPSLLPVPKVHVSTGVLPGVDVSGFLSTVPGRNIDLYGGGVKYNLIKGGMLTPSLAIRAHGTRLQGVDDLDLDTYGGDLSVSKSFTFLTPYAGYSHVEIDGEYTGDNPLLRPRLNSVRASEGRVFAGARFSLFLLSFVAEADFSEVNIYSLRANLEF